jgi:hypothetical protein
MKMIIFSRAETTLSYAIILSKSKALGSLITLYNLDNDSAEIDLVINNGKWQTTNLTAVEIWYIPQVWELNAEPLNWAQTPIP